MHTLYKPVETNINVVNRETPNTNSEFIYNFDKPKTCVYIQWCSPNSNCSISKLHLVPKRAFNVKFVPLIASSPISKQIHAKCDLLLREHHCI